MTDPPLGRRDPLQSLVAQYSRRSEHPKFCEKLSARAILNLENTAYNAELSVLTPAKYEA